MSDGLRVQLLGETLLTRDGVVVPAGGPRRAAIVAVLALRAPRSASRAELASALWGGQPPVSVVNALHVHISALRRTLGREAIQTAGDGYRLGADVAVDAREFCRAAARGADQLARGHAEAATATLEAALDLWRGPPLADLDESAFVATEAARLLELRLVVIEDRVHADLALGRHRDVIAELEMLVGAHPLREGLRGQLMRALYRSGRQAEALAVYDSGRRILRDELGLDPAPELRELHQLLLTQGDEPTAQPPSLAATWHLPALLDETIGRASELHSLTGLIGAAQARLVTILGPGGVGKSRLAIAAGEQLRNVLPDGVAFVSLAQADKAGDVAVTICAALRLRTDDDPMSTLESTLHNRRMLLICDNFEHVLDAASLLPQLLAAAPGVQIMVTSRQPLGLRGERRFLLQPLSADALEEGPSPAAQLFLVRAVDADSAFDPTATELEDIAEIARRCDGLPLAVELAAAHTRAIPVSTLRQRLQSPLSMLTGDSRDAPDRHRTMRASIAWSMSALDRRYARLLAQLTVFRGGFSLTAAAAASELDADITLGYLEVLLDHSLLRRVTSPSGAPRFDLLQTIREYGAELLDPAEYAAVRLRHASHFRAWLRPIDEPGKFAADVAVWLAQLAERANVRQAIRWALASSDGSLAADLIVSAAAIWDHSGPRAELQEWLAELLDRSDVGVGRRCDACWWTAALVADSDSGRMDAPLAQARGLARDSGDTRRLAWVQLLCAVAELHRDRPDAAADELAAGWTLAEQHPEAVNLHISLLMAMGHLATVQGADLGPAVEFTERALALAKRHHRDLRSMTLLNNLSEIMIVQDKADRAREFAADGLVLAELAQSQDGMAANLSQRGYASLLTGDVTAALTDLRAALFGHLQLGTTYYALHDTIRLAATLTFLDAELAACALGVVQACPTFVDQASSRQARDRYLTALEGRFPAELARGHDLVERRGESGAMAWLLEATSVLPRAEDAAGRGR